MESAVEALFSEGDEALLSLLPPVEAFMNEPIKVCALRLTFLGLADKTRKAEFSFTALYNEWNRLLGRMGGKGDRATKRKLETGFELNENDIRRYVFLENLPRAPKRKAALLALLAVHEIERSGTTEGSTQRLIRAAREAFDFVEPILNFLRTKDISALDLKPKDEGSGEGKPNTPPVDAAAAPAYAALASLLKANDLEGVANKALRTLLKVDPADQKNIARWLFDESDIGNLISTPERSYYALYRYSTQIPEIVKTLLVINSPALSGQDCFSFAHVYLSKRNKVKRITRGTLVSFPKSIYFVGMSAQVLRGRDPLGRPKIDQAEGLKIIVVPTSEAQTGYDLLPGVYMSNSLKWQPIVGRLALVHIGFQSTVGPLSDATKEAKPSILLGPDALADDLRKICALPKSTHGEENAADLAKRILIKINNRPFCDRDRPGLATEGMTRALLPEDEQTPGP